MTYWTESLGRIELNITKKQAAACSHPGECSHDVQELRKVPIIQRQLNKLTPHLVAVCLSEYGVWDDEELLDHEENLHRLLWVACCDISEGNV